ncbi:MAG: ABC transporter permease, partial [Bacteroidales bacterium]|nr:ABC transporter permease [Bacteroidales bacterium]
MKGIRATLWVEILKVRKSQIFWGSIIFFMFITSMMGLFMFVQMHPEIAGKLGMIGNKATMMRFGLPNWNNYLILLMQVIAGVGLIGIGFVASWVFGREFSEHTLKDILALPISRTCIVYSKFIVIFIWSVILSFVFFATGLLMGLLIGLPDLSSEIVIQYASKYFTTTFLILLLSTPVAFLASYSRGYILPLGFVILTLIIANFVGMIGLGPYFPWAIPGLYGTPGLTEDLQLNIYSYII